MIRRPPRSTLDRSSAASDVYKRQINNQFVKNEATVYWDDRLVPHIFAQGEAEAFYVLSLIHISEPRDRTKYRIPAFA